VDDANAPPTNMPLVLTGIIAASDPKSGMGMAIIGTQAGNAKIYPVGQRVPGNARVHAVYVDRVLLERNGVIEALTLPKKLGGGRPALAAEGHCQRTGPDFRCPKTSAGFCGRQAAWLSGLPGPQCEGFCHAGTAQW
jgi:hypothetical protein